MRRMSIEQCPIYKPSAIWYTSIPSPLIPPFTKPDGSLSTSLIIFITNL